MKIIGVILILGVMVLISGCATGLHPGGPTPAGMLYTGVKSPAPSLAISTDATAKPIKTGTASAAAVLGLFATGDASLDAAMKAGGITKIHHVDHEVNSVLLGLWVQDTTIVYGE